jgi:hypothetical protein
MLKMDEKMSEEQREVAGKEYNDLVEPVESTTAETVYGYEPQPAAPAGGGGSTCRTSCGTGCANTSGGATTTRRTFYVDDSSGVHDRREFRSLEDAKRYANTLSGAVVFDENWRSVYRNNNNSATQNNFEDSSY